MKLKKCTELNNLNLLKDYGINGVIYKIRNLKRTFCSCGKVYGKEINECTCGNNTFVRVDAYGYGRDSRVQTVRHYSEIYPGEYQVKETGLDFVNINEEIAELRETEEVVYEITKDKITETSSGGRYWYKFKGEYFRGNPIFDSISDIFEKSGFSKNYEPYYTVFKTQNYSFERKINDFITFYNTNKTLMNELFITNKDLLKVFIENSSGVNLKTFNLQKVYEMYLIPDFLSSHSFREVSLAYNPAPTKDYYKRKEENRELYNYFMKLSKDEKRFISNNFHIISLIKEHSLLFSKNLLEYIKKLDETERDLFILFTKEHLILGLNPIEEYQRRKNLLIKYLLPVNAENMKLKQTNSISNYENLINDKFNKEKIDYFMEVLDDNPLLAITFLANKRKPDKNEKKILAEHIKKKMK